MNQQRIWGKNISEETVLRIKDAMKMIFLMFLGKKEHVINQIYRLKKEFTHRKDCLLTSNNYI